MLSCFCLVFHVTLDHTDKKKDKNVILENLINDGAKRHDCEGRVTLTEGGLL